MTSSSSAVAPRPRTRPRRPSRSSRPNTAGSTGSTGSRSNPAAAGAPRPAKSAPRSGSSAPRSGSSGAHSDSAGSRLNSAASARPVVSSAGFAELGLSTSVVDALAVAGIVHPTPIQSATLPDALAGRDLLGRARTGSGKTLAFGLPMLQRLAANPERRSGRPRGLVLLPTRELAQQVEAALRPLAAALGLRVRVVVGGVPIGRQVKELNGGVDVLVATPGRLEDLLARRSVALDAVRVAVLDEADHMADLGFLPAVRRILEATPRDRQCLLFSATLDGDVDALVRRYLRNPAVHRVDDGDEATSVMEHHVFRLTHEHKVDVAAEIADREERTLFFVRTKHGADRLAKQFRSRGVQATSLHGNLNQNQRRRALDSFTAGTTPVLVATDVAARGIHVDSLDLVVHFDPPVDHKVYSHRSGRTARAGASGTVVTLVEPHQLDDVSRIHAAAKVQAQSARVQPGHPVLRTVASTGR